MTCVHVYMIVWTGWSQISENCTSVSQHILPSPLLSVLVPWQRWMRLWCGRRSCPRWMPHRCPSSPHPPPRTARPCPPSVDVANCWAAARGVAAATAGPPARLLPPLPLPLHPAEGRWRAAAQAGWTGSIPGRLKGKIASIINKLRVLLNSAHCKLHKALIQCNSRLMLYTPLCCDRNHFSLTNYLKSLLLLFIYLNKSWPTVSEIQHFLQLFHIKSLTILFRQTMLYSPNISSYLDWRGSKNKAWCTREKLCDAL